MDRKIRELKILYLAEKEQFRRVVQSRNKYQKTKTKHFEWWYKEDMACLKSIKRSIRIREKNLEKAKRK